MCHDAPTSFLPSLFSPSYRPPPPPPPAEGVGGLRVAGPVCLLRDLPSTARHYLPRAGQVRDPPASQPTLKPTQYFLSWNNPRIQPSADA